MNWLCEICGYENQFDDNEQLTVCRCCGDPASEKVLFQARQELEAFRRAEKTKAIAETARKRKELWRQRIDSIAKGALYFAKAVPALMILSVIAAFVWVVYRFNSSDLTFASWSRQAQSNISELTFQETALSSIQNGVGYIFSTAEDMPSGSRKDMEKCSENLGAIIEIAGMQQENRIENVLLLHDATNVKLQRMKDQTIEMSQRNIVTVRYLTSNLQVFWDNATENIELLTEKIAKREVLFRWLVSFLR